MSGQIIYSYNSNGLYELGVIIQRYRVELAYNFTPSTPKLILRGRVELLPNYTIFIDIKCN